MPRRIVLKRDEIYKQRARNWELHYSNRKTVSAIAQSADVSKVLALIARHVPPPEMMIDADLVGGREVKRGQLEVVNLLRYPIASRDLMLLWYWDAHHWQGFVHEFQSLPEVYEDWYYQYDAGIDALRLVPMSSKPKQGSGLAVGIPVDNLGTTRLEKVQVRK